MKRADVPTPERSRGKVTRPKSAPAANAEFSRCWAEIGVYGNGTCHELEKFVHCRNCPEYSAGALELLNRKIPAEYRREVSQHLATAKRTANGPTISAVLFRLQTEWLALPTHSLQEV